MPTIISLSQVWKKLESATKMVLTVNSETSSKIGLAFTSMIRPTGASG